MRKFVVMTAMLGWAMFSAGALAQPTAFTYQGQLKNNGSLAEGQHDFRFRLFDAASGGTQVGTTQCADNILVKDGVFTATMDFGNQFATPNQRFIEILVRRDTGLGCADVSGFATLSPRQPITPAPTATQAASAFSLAAPDGSPANAVFVDNDGNVGIGTTTPTSSLHINAPVPLIRLQDTAGAQQGYLELLDSAGNPTGYSGFGSSTAPHFTIWNRRPGGGLQFGTQDQDRVFITGTGNVGIGTTSPGVPLHIARDIDPVLVIQDIGPASTQAGYVGFWNNAGAETGWMGFGTPGSPHMTIFNGRSTGDIVLRPASGKVRIGSSGQFFASAGEENLHIVRGVVKSDATIGAGTGFSVAHPSTGEYVITFSTPFASAPTVTASTGVFELDNIASWAALNRFGVTIRVWCSIGSGGGCNREFSFIAVGPR